MINQLLFIPVHVQTSFVQMDGDVLRVTKDETITGFNENTYAKLLGNTFHNSEIRVKVYSRLLANAPAMTLKWGPRPSERLDSL